MTDLAKQGKVEYEEFEQNANKYFLLLRDTNPIALVTDVQLSFNSAFNRTSRLNP